MDLFQETKKTSSGKDIFTTPSWYNPLKTVLNDKKVVETIHKVFLGNFQNDHNMRVLTRRVLTSANWTFLAPRILVTCYC